MERKTAIYLGLFVFISVLCLSFASAAVVEIPANQRGDYRDGWVSDIGTTDTTSGSLFVGDDTSNYFRSFIDFNTSLVPDGATINSIWTQLTASAVSSGTIQAIGLNQTSTKFTNAQLLAACGGGAGSTGIYNSSVTIFSSGANNPKNVSLTGSAILNLTNQLTEDYFSFCLYMLGDDSLPGVETDFHSNESATIDYIPRLFVNYTAAATPALNVTLVNPSVNANVVYGRLFNFTVNVSCLNAGCGAVNVSLDPRVIMELNMTEEPIPTAENKALQVSFWVILAVFVLLSVSLCSFFRKTHLRNKWIMFVVLALLIMVLIWLGIKITGFASMGMVSTTIGATPFYTISHNPLNGTDFPCLANMNAGDNCSVFWELNSTGALAAYEFFAYANSTSLGVLSYESSKINLTILQEDLQAPVIRTIPEYDPYFAAPVLQTWNGTISFSANVTDNINVSSVWLNVTSAGTVYAMNYAGNDSYTVDVNATDFSLGLQYFIIYANDTSNLRSNTSLENFSVLDLLKPTIANITINPTYPNPSSTVDINASIFDDYAIDSAWVEIITPNGLRTNYSMPNESIRYGYTYLAAARGRYIVYIYANDSSGNVRTSGAPRYFYVPPVILTDKDFYTQTQEILITGFGFSSNLNITITIGNLTANLTIFNISSTGAGLISGSYLIPRETGSGNYTVYAYDSGFGVTVFKEIGINGVVIVYPAGSVLIPGDDKQNPGAYDLDFLRMYGLVYNALNNGYKLDWVITPDCARFNATNVDTATKYNELFCHGFWLIKENATDALTYLNSVRGSVQILTLNEQGSVPKAQIIQLRRAPRVAVLGGSQGQITSTLTRSNMPYTLLTENDVINSSILNTSRYDILLVGDYDFTKAPSSVAGNISRYVNSGGDCHAEDEGAITLDSYTNFLGNLAEDGTYRGNINIITPANSLTQTQLDAFSNSYGTYSVLDVSSATNAYTVLLADENFPPSTNVKLISMNVGKGFVTYSGGHIGSSQGSSELGRPRNRILDNLLLFSVNINDLTIPDVLNLTPSEATNVTQFRAVNLSAFVTDNRVVDSVLANVSWATGSEILILSGPDVLSNYAATFTNTNYVIDKNTPTLYNITFFANDTNGNTANASTYFYVIPDKIPYWSLNSSFAPAAYNLSVNSSFGMMWDDDFGFSSVVFDSNFTGNSANYSFSSYQGNQTCRNYTFSRVLPAGTYSWRYNAQDDYNQANSSLTWSFTIAKANSEINLSINGVSANASALSSDTVNLSVSRIAGDANALLYVDNLLAGAGTSFSVLNSYSAGLHNVTAVYPEGQNYSASSVTYYLNITQSSSSGGGDSGGGGGGACADTSWSCESWSECFNDTKTRQCISNCNKNKIENSSCLTNCTNECLVEGDYCNNNAVERCQIVDSCYKTTVIRSCTDEEICYNATCTAGSGEQPAPSYGDYQPSYTDRFNETEGNSNGGVWGGMTPVQKAGTVAVAAAAGIGLIWVLILWAIGLLVPLFVLKLKHYIVFIFDSANELKVFENNKLNKQRLAELLIMLEKNFEKLAFSEKNEETIRYVSKSGFIELRVDEPFILAAHFTNEDDTERFEEALRKTLNHFNSKIRINRKVEKASIIRAVRAFLRKRRSEREIRRLFK